VGQYRKFFYAKAHAPTPTGESRRGRRM